jgi:hypothetical protein
MCRMSERKEVILTVPAELTRHCRGLALDMGKSGLVSRLLTSTLFHKLEKLGQMT